MRKSKTKYIYSERCRFLGKEVREKRRALVASPHIFAPALSAPRNHTLAHKFTQLSELKLTPTVPKH